MSRRPLLIVFLKAPRPGAVKTRLARGIGAVAAWRFYRGTVLALLRRTARQPGWDTVIAVTPDIDARGGVPMFRGFDRVPQGRGDLGQRMARAMLGAGARPVVLVGGDIPDLRRHHITEAFQALGRADAVFGPATDGGFWLVGLRHPKRDACSLFRGVRWSGPHALADTLGNLRPPLRAELVETLSDVDTPEDYLAHLKRNKTG